MADPRRRDGGLRVRNADLDVFAYFNNDERAYATRDALRLRELVG